MFNSVNLLNRYTWISTLKFIRESRVLYFRVNSRERSDAKIKSSPIISDVSIKEQNITYRENKVS